MWDMLRLSPGWGFSRMRNGLNALPPTSSGFTFMTFEAWLITMLQGWGRSILIVWLFIYPEKLSGLASYSHPIRLSK
jgi:hypothetical protein